MAEVADRSPWALNDRIARQDISASDIIFDIVIRTKDTLPFCPYSLVHIELLDQYSLISIIEEWNISLVLDLRFRPIFDGPNFEHRKTIEMFQEENVLYVDCVFYASNSQDEDEVMNRYHNAFRGLANKNYWSIIIFDDDTIETGLLSEFRNGLRSGVKLFREVHPELLFGSTRWAALSLDPPPKPA